VTTAAPLPVEVTFRTAPAVLEAASAGLAEGPRDVDLAACTVFDSSLLGTLLELQRRAAARGGRCRFLHPPPNLRKLAALYGVDGLLFERRD